MAMPATDIEKLIKAAFPDADVTITALAGRQRPLGRHGHVDRLQGQSRRVQQHQMVYAALQGRMGGVLHALSLQTMAVD